MQIPIIQTEAADFVKINICVILKTFGHDCIVWGQFSAKYKDETPTWSFLCLSDKGQTLENKLPLEPACQEDKTVEEI